MLNKIHSSLSKFMPKKKKRRPKRGHPIGILIGLHIDNAVIWKVYSNSIRFFLKVSRGRKRRNQSRKQLYNFHEKLINVLRPIIKEGNRNLILLSPPKELYSNEFLNHINKHHRWLLKKGESQVILSKVVGNQAKTKKDILYLKSQESFKNIIDKSSNQEGLLILGQLKDLINKNENHSKILYTLEEINRELRLIKENPNKNKPNYIILTEEYITNPKNRNKAHRILQIAKNLEIKTKIVKQESEAGAILDKFGGLICFFEYF